MTTPSNPDEATSSAPPRPTIIGLYGVSGCGKSHLSTEIQRAATDIAQQTFAFYDGSTLIDRVTHGGLAAFKKHSKASKRLAREHAIDLVARECSASGKVGVVTGHLLLPDQAIDGGLENIGTEKDWATYTHMIYLNVDPGIIAERRARDTQRPRESLASEELRVWQNRERRLLREICVHYCILFTAVQERSGFGTVGLPPVQRVAELLEGFFQRDHEEKNAQAVKTAVDAIVAEKKSDLLNTMIVLDADKTLAPVDTGAMFWKTLGKHDSFPGTDLLRPIFKSQGYSFAAFRQAILLYEEAEEHFDTLCEQVAEKVNMYPEMKALLERVGTEPRFGAVVVTCGLRQVWERVLSKNGLHHVKVIGAGRLADGYVVTAAAKGDIVDHLHANKLRVLGFGDSPLDMDMLCKADEAYIVVGDEESRSKGMDEALRRAIIDSRLSALQILFPSSASWRLDLNLLPRMTLNNAELKFLFHQRIPVMHTTLTGAGILLASSSRDASTSGPGLRQAHETIGWFLAISVLSTVLGLEEISIPHVQGNLTNGYRIRYEKNTLIVPLMRGGEPMALGVSRALPLASFVHAKQFSDIDLGHFVGKRTIILVDSVINTGKSIAEFLVPLRERLPHVRVIVVTGVVQSNALKAGLLADMILSDELLWIVALRESKNKYRGIGGTDTGHRLFNTTYLA